MTSTYWTNGTDGMALFGINGAAAVCMVEAGAGAAPRYRKDNNKTPPESVLLPITTHLCHFLNKVPLPDTALGCVGAASLSGKQ
jgi:hypothetical protein